MTGRKRIRRRRKPRETVELFPSYAARDPERGGWRVMIRGRVVTPRPDNLRRKLLLRVIRRVLRASPEQLGSRIFAERVRGFLMLTLGGRKIRVHIQGHSFLLSKPSRRNGHFQATLWVPEELPTPSGVSSDTGNGESTCAADGAAAWTPVRAGLASRAHAPYTGRVQRIAAQGASVISDIDDTIKWSNVLHRRELLTNTFFMPFRDIPGMSDLYRRWGQEGAVFHYVSSSPWQLFSPLAQFLQQSGFPDGTFHLRQIRLRDTSVLQLFLGGTRSKARAIRTILQAFPQRRFLLVGDTGERDPEIYGAMARQFPAQVQQICLRRLPPPGDLVGSRLNRALRGVDPALWRLFDDPRELCELSPGRGQGWGVATMAPVVESVPWAGEPGGPVGFGRRL